MCHVDKNWREIMTTPLALRDASFATFLSALLWDSWSHPETRRQATTWGLVAHVAFFGSSSDTARRLLGAPAFFYAHGVLAGWLQFTWFNPQLDLSDKVRAWGCTRAQAVARTIVVHLLPIAAHWWTLLSERAEWRRLYGGKSAIELAIRALGPSFGLLLLYRHLYPSLTTTYNIKGVSDDKMGKLQTVAIAALNLGVVWPLWRRAVTSRH